MVSEIVYRQQIDGRQRIFEFLLYPFSFQV